jgi:two-component system heavy metal sensor histidine kinase CusS
LLRRIDIRLGLGLAAAIGLLLVVMMSVFFLIATHETAELLQEVVRDELSAAATQIEKGAGRLPRHAGDHPSEVSLRVTDASGRETAVQGEWPRAGRAWEGRRPSLGLAFASGDGHLLERRPLSGGRVLEGALPLEDFAQERAELLGQIFWSLGIVAILLFALAAIATRLALSPLRTATISLARIDEHHLDSRIALRGSADDVDRHALALNHVLQRLEDAFQRVAAFSADVAHELRTPVNRILNAADLALLRDPGGEPQTELLAVREAAEEMRRLIDDLLLLARGDEGRLGVASEPFDLVAATSSLVALFRPICEDRRIVLTFRAARGEIIAFGDHPLLERAIANLLDNAVRHTPDGGCIQVALEIRAPWLEIAVSDSGPGVAERERERIFERFVQLDESRTTEGSGLGLALARMLARAHGGDVQAEASALGGACFRIRLPAQRVAAGSRREADAAGRPSARASA